jgi:hypothetical protein
MSNSERVERFSEDSIKILTQNPFKVQKLTTEISKLKKWLQKHQDESLPSGHKDKLLQCIQSYHVFTLKLAETETKKNGVISELTVEVAGRVLELVQDLCMLPEGKLVAGKSSKSKALKWIGQLTTIVNREELPMGGLNTCTKLFELIDVSHINAESYELELMDPESGDVKNTIYATSDTIFKERFENGESVLVEVDLETHEVLRVTYE